MKAVWIRVGLAAAGLGVLGVAWLQLRYGPIGDDGPGAVYSFAPFVAAVLFSLMIAARQAILRGLIAGVLAFGLVIAMTEPWYDADIAHNGPMSYKGEAVAMVTWLFGFPASLITGVIVFAGSWLRAGPGRDNV